MLLNRAVSVSLAAALAMSLAGPAFAGAFIIDGTDADDHGYASGGANQQGWFYIQRGLENLASSSSVTRTQKTIAVLGADPGTQAGNAVQSAVSLSTALSSAGWTVQYLNGSQISDFFNNTGSGLKSTGASLIYMSSFDDETSGGLNDTEQAIIDANAMNINNFLGTGGGLFSHVQGYGWLTTLIPGLQVTFGGDQGIALTPTGHSLFPGLTNADLSAGPYHANFYNTGVVPILGVDDGGYLGGDAVILGGAGGKSGTVTNPTGSVPEAATWATMVMGFGLMGAAMRRRPRASVSFS